jgi:hypothetical protein
MENKEQLKSMIQDLINDDAPAAEAALHDYLAAKMRDVAGLGGKTATETPEAE